MPRKLFCDINPTCYKISLQKEIVLRHLKNMINYKAFARDYSNDTLPNIIKSHSSILLRKLYGVDMKLQENKVTNIEIACKKVLSRNKKNL